MAAQPGTVTEVQGQGGTWINHHHQPTGKPPGIQKPPATPASHTKFILEKPKKMLLMTQGTNKQHVDRTHAYLSIQHSQRGFSDPDATKPLEDQQ